jgi:tRNA (guanosine-2'-O-)-methyltransferase
MTPKRKHLLMRAAANRQKDLIVVLENVHDPHNISAVLRSCDSVGVSELYLLLTDPAMHIKKIQMGKRSSAGARKWIKVYRYHDAKTCFQDIRSKCDHIYGTFLGEKEPKDLFKMNLTNPCAFVFGNEQKGISKEVQDLCDGHFIIPQAGLVQSLNISVACAVTLYEAYRQRRNASMYARPKDHPFTKEAMQFFTDRIESGDNGRNIEKR